MNVSQAANGADALARLSDEQPDVIVTDLQMPEMDGLTLVTAVRIHYPRVPVVLITAHGSEELAVRALEQGAASYVPKSQLAGSLLAAVDQVLELAHEDRAYAALSQAMEYAEFRFRADNDFTTTDRLVQLVQQLAASLGVCDTGGQVRLGIALEEAFRLAILRGNLELTPTALMALGARPEEMERWLADRRSQPPFDRRCVRVHVRIAPEEAFVSIGHDGPAWNVAAPQNPGAGPSLEDPSDRSLVLMRAFLDEVNFSADGTGVTLVKRKRAK
jgi:DNA-binding response OmpR family regulator